MLQDIIISYILPVIVLVGGSIAYYHFAVIKTAKRVFGKKEYKEYVSIKHKNQ